MKRKRAALTLLAVAALAEAPALAQEQLPVRNCAWCHGASAQGSGAAPRIAGQRASYIEKELLEFREHARDNPASKQYMWGATARLSPQAAHDFAQYYSALPAQPAEDGDGSLVESGKLIYEQGVPDANVVSCIVCHGPRGEGFDAIPRLGGMSYAYIKGRLEQWTKGYDASAHPMPIVSSKLSAADIEALASYVSFLK